MLILRSHHQAPQPEPSDAFAGRTTTHVKPRPFAFRWWSPADSPTGCYRPQRPKGDAKTRADQPQVVGTHSWPPAETSTLPLTLEQRAAGDTPSGGALCGMCDFTACGRDHGAWPPPKRPQRSIIETSERRPTPVTKSAQIIVDSAHRKSAAGPIWADVTADSMHRSVAGRALRERRSSDAVRANVCPATPAR